MDKIYQNLLVKIFQEKYEQEQAKDAVYLTLKEAILSKDIPPNISLNSAYLSKIFFLSRTPIEHALSRLLYEKIIAYTQQNGYNTYALNYDEARDGNEFMLYLYLSSNLIIHQKLDFYYVNLLEKKLTQLNQINDIKTFLLEGNLFHLLIAEGTRNKCLIHSLKHETENISLIELDYKDNEESENFIVEHRIHDMELLHALQNGTREDVFKKSMEHNLHMMHFIFKNSIV